MAVVTLVGILTRAQLFEDHAGKRQGVICLDLCCKREEVHAAMLLIDLLAKKVLPSFLRKINYAVGNDELANC